jgi:hypothetical protein
MACIGKPAGDEAWKTHDFKKELSQGDIEALQPATFIRTRAGVYQVRKILRKQ